MNTEIIFAVLAVIFGGLNLFLWSLLAGGGKNEGPGKEEGMQSALTEIRSAFREIGEVAAKLNQENKALTEKLSQDIKTLQEKIKSLAETNEVKVSGEWKEDINRNRENMEKLTANIEENTCQLKKVEDIIEDLDVNLTMLNDSMESDRKT